MSLARNYIARRDVDGRVIDKAWQAHIGSLTSNLKRFGAEQPPTSSEIRPPRPTSMVPLWRHKRFASRLDFGRAAYGEHLLKSIGFGGDVTTASGPRHRRPSHACSGPKQGRARASTEGRC